MRILALVPGGIGDQILFFPTLATLKQTYPQAQIDVLVEPRSKGAYRVCPSVSDVLVFDYKDRNGLADYLNLLGMIRDREYDIALTLGQRWAVGLLLWLNGITTRVGYESPKSCLLTATVPLKTEQYAAEMYHDLLLGLGIQTPCPTPTITVPKSDIDWAEATQDRMGIRDTGYILIHGGSSQLAVTKGIDKIYPPQNWSAIIADLQTKQPDVPIVVIKGPEDSALVGELLAKAPNLKVVSPPDIGKLAAFIAGANLMLCTDSAPMHLAIAVGTYTIALFGPTDAKKLVPPNSETCIPIQSPSKAIGDIAPVTVLEQIWRG
ncbi:glycosyltransferase family 9 protein [Spirulina subsalsa FACHB-351]|uniref:Glycosyltransferase family 9 protein n=1 Tax=Spirulina subsalsa FACHB-351 TaxID=234711 RepID=A0ABT3L669_9CYAN|nr:glycosyltransferase family 9 protein [Spirulina subsalsa]MCW6036998.1 glycosyltransferase family 9 protein [Spirulina subsalsa FACHB-351]